ncbi:cation:proton antiporter [Parvibium lacunae]|uniref:Sodium:proton antiporter n=1 Tax=Parvibium lacunae TaxID=1888893 RepID=A0A368L0J2_9BURK|nr:cation:proton antiporter [Parvibium lacunae]RCS57081.1 sodium:proton antiporter [Parvibium lacunae]
MAHSLNLITTLAASLALALPLGLLAHALRMPTILGYLLAGVLLGPGTPGFVADQVLSAQLAEIGVMLLMFGVGLHFSVGDLMAVRRIAIPGAVVQIATATLLGLAVALAWGWPWGTGLIFGLALSVASTVVLIRALEQNQQLHSTNGQIAVGWLVVEDFVMVLVLVLLPALAGLLAPATGSPQPTLDLSSALLKTLGQIVLFVALMLLIGRRFLPWLLWHVASRGSRELFTLCVVALALGIAYAAAHWFGVSYALGAFFAGMVMRESHLAQRAAEDSLPLREAFSVLFFVAVGMLLDPQILLQSPGKVVAVLAIIVFGKSLAAALLVLLWRYPLNTALTVSASLAQIGEFSFILAGLGLTYGLLSPEANSLIVAGALFSIAFNPVLFRLIQPLQTWLCRHSSRARQMAMTQDPLAVLPDTTPAAQLTAHTIIVGYGAIGAQLGAMLRDAGQPWVVIERNRQSVEGLRQQTVSAVAGDATTPEALIQGHVMRAAQMVVTVQDAACVQAVLQLAHTLNPNLPCLVLSDSAEDASHFALLPNTTVIQTPHALAQTVLHFIHPITRKQ